MRPMQRPNADRAVCFGRFLPYGRQSIDEEDIQAVVEVLRGDFITQGPMIERFEATIADIAGAQFCVAVTSGTAALHIACMAAGLKPGEKGLTTPITFVASANAILYCGAELGLVDVDPEHLCMSPQALKASLAADPSPRVVIPVDFGGLAADMAEIRAVAGDRIVIEDASHSLGGAYPNGRPIGCGDYSDMTVFSFHPVKPITTGEGGAVVTNDPELYRLLKLHRNHGIERTPTAFTNRAEAFDGDKPNPWWYEQQAMGFNYRITDIQAALGWSQAQRLHRFIERRREVAKRYDAAFHGLNHIRIPQAAPQDRDRSGLHLYLLEVDFEAIGLSRREMMERLREEGVGSQVHYIPVHWQPHHKAILGEISLPNAEAYYRRTLTLPLHPSLTDDEADRVIAAVRRQVQG